MSQNKDLKIISYSIFGYSGSNGNYWSYIPAMLRAHSLLFPDYKVVLYHDDTLPNMQYGKVLKQLNSDNVIDLHYMGPKQELCKSMLWRCRAIWDYAKAKAVFFRDIDSCPTYRERCANEAFVKSVFSTHGINDNKQHSVPLMGGLWGCKPILFISRTGITSWKHFMSYYVSFNLETHGEDQILLSKCILPFVKTSLLVHKDIKITSFPDIDEDVKKKSSSFIPYMGAAGYEREFVIDYCNTKKTPFIDRLKEVEAGYGIEAKTHKYVKLKD